jgi:hypothetical protein
MTATKFSLRHSLKFFSCKLLDSITNVPVPLTHSNYFPYSYLVALKSLAMYNRVITLRPKQNENKRFGPILNVYFI